MSLMLYVHVPFCRSRCRYCGFFSEPLHGSDGEERVLRYLSGVKAECSLRAAEAGDGVLVTSIFFGGGTPSLLPEGSLESLLDVIRQTFSVASDAEISLEGNPESLIIPGRMKRLYAAGFNRLSMGVQSMHDRDLRLLGRPHDPCDVVKAVEMARNAGFSNVGVDLMWGLPGQTVAGWTRQLARVTELGVEHVSAYGLTLEPGTPLARDVERGLCLPEEGVLEAMYLEGAAYLESQGFLQYEISNFARPGFSCRHNRGYWSGCYYLGFGPSAVSTINGQRRANVADTEAWFAMTEQGMVPECEKRDALDDAEEFLMLRLRTVQGLEMNEFASRTGIDLMRCAGDFLQELVHAGLAEMEEGRMQLTKRGMLVSNAILATLFERVFDPLRGNDVSAFH